MSADVLPDNSTIMTGFVEDLVTHDLHLFALHIDSIGDTLWTNRYPELGSGVFWDVSTSSSSYISACGIVQNIPVIVGIAESGNVEWSFSLSENTGALNSIAVNGANTVACGSILNNSDDYDIFAVLLIDSGQSVNKFRPIGERDIYLRQNYPNPFNPATTISFDLTHPGMVKLNVFDVTGRLVSTLVDGNMIAGEYNVMFDGAGLSSGIYFARLEAGKYMQTQKMVLLK